ncbi:MAG: hypothetical protein RL417_1437 [Pseudomonadota bacterium]|jgi:peptidoglycan/LPS O-acetylase OafA/YrhL
MHYRRDIDGLRALAVLPVILFHAGWSLCSGGFVGVDIFFVISGFLITSILIGELDSKSFSLIRFYERRARRILPALTFVVLCSLPLAWLFMLPNELEALSKSILSIALFVSNFFFRAETDYFGTDAEEKPFLHTWSLAVEEQYYFVFPLLLAWLWRWGRRSVGTSLVLLAAVSLAFAEWQIRLNPEQIFFDTRARIWELLGGALVAVYLSTPGRREFGRTAQQLGSIVGLGLILFSIVRFDEGTESPGLPILLPVLGAMLVILFSSSATFVGKVLGCRPLVGIGLISYSAYLWHQPLLAFTRLRSPEEPSTAALMLASALSLVLAYPTWRYIEQPFRDRTKIGRRPVFTFAFASTAMLALLGGIGIWRKGFTHHFKSDRQISQTFEELQRERGAITRSGECQYNRKTGANSYDLFLKRWACDRDGARPDLQPIGVIVVGDSHSADIASALRSNGYSPAQIGAPGCSVIPSRMGKGCRKIFSFIKEFAAQRPEYTHIILANRWDTKEVRPEYLAEMTAYWSLPGKKLVFVTSRPEFHGYKRALRMGLALRPNMKRAETSSAPEVLEFLAKSNVAIVNAREIFCSLTPRCDWKDENGRHLTTDGHHLTRYGAELFGRKMLAQGVLPVGGEASSVASVEEERGAPILR